MKKISLLAFLLLLQSNIVQPNIVLSSPLLRIADNAGIFNSAIIDILLTRLDVIALIQGEKEWKGAVVKLIVNENQNISLTAYCRRPEIIFGATFVSITPDHELLTALTTKNQQNVVENYLATIKNKSLYERQMTSTLDGVFTGSYAINPLSKELLPIYVSDHSIECFDSRHSQTRIGVPAHVSKDFDFAKYNKIPLKIVVNVADKYEGKRDDFGPVVAAPQLDKNGNLKEAYLGEYRECVVKHSDFLTDLPLKDAAALVIEYLEENGLGYGHTESLQYQYNDKNYSIKDIAKIEAAVYKNTAPSQIATDQKNALRIILIHAQADFLEIVEKFIVNIKNTRSLMVALIEESCALRKNPDCYLLKWAHLNTNENEKEIFRRDITNSKELFIFCRDLIHFLEDLAHSCPNAINSINQ